MIKKMWVKFDEMDVECFCNERDRKCKKDCKEYVVKFMEIRRDISDSTKKIAAIIKKSEKDLKKVVSEMEKSIRKFKV